MMPVEHRPHPVLAALGTALLLAAAGCAGSSGGPAPSQAPESPSPTPNVSSAAPSGPDITDVPGGAGPGTATGTAPSGGPGARTAAVETCTSADLRLSLGRGDGAAGTYYRPLRFTNVGDGPCVIAGFPGVSYVAGEDGHQVGPPAAREGDAGGPVTLAQGGVAHTVVGFVQVRNYDEAACRPTPVNGLRVYPPGETASLFVRVPGTGCAADAMPGPQLTVRAVTPGAGAP